MRRSPSPAFLFAVFVASASVVVAWTYWSNYRARRKTPSRESLPSLEANRQLIKIGLDAVGEGESVLLEKDGSLVVFFPDEAEDDRVYDDAILVELGLALWSRMERESQHGPERDWEDYESRS